MRICIDIDGTLCELKNLIGSYENVLPLPGCIEFIHKCKELGHTVILYTSRHMKTCIGNVGLVLAKQGLTLFEWLNKYNIEYDEIYFGKPHADIYIDDNALKFDGNWSKFLSDSFFNLKSNENSFKFNIIITMAGAGKRFKDAGYDLPKPLIPINTKPMYRVAVDSLPLEYSDNLIFLIPSIDSTELIKNDIISNYSKYNISIVVIPHLTRGQAETCLFAENYISFNKPTLVHNCDSAINVDTNKFIQSLKESDGLLLTFETNGDKYSYAKINEFGQVIEVREKKEISTHASTGTYYFKSSVQFFNLIKNSIENDERENNEFYIAPLYNKMIAAGQNIKIFNCNQYFCFGTPEQLKKIYKLNDYNN